MREIRTVDRGGIAAVDTQTEDRLLALARLADHVEERPAVLDLCEPWCSCHGSADTIGWW